MHACVLCVLLFGVAFHLVDPSWSILDNQAVDRVYRIGQKRDVIIYRLITCGTVEEKIYRKQVFKQSLMHTTMEDDSAYRYFTKQELRELFNLEDPSSSITQKQLAVLHKGQRKTYPALEEDIRFIESQKNAFGVSDHDLLFTVKNPSVHVSKPEELEKRVHTAVDNIKKSEPKKDEKTSEANPIVIDDSDSDSDNRNPIPTRKKKVSKKVIDDSDDDDEIIDSLSEDEAFIVQKTRKPEIIKKRLRHTYQGGISEDSLSNDEESDDNALSDPAEPKRKIRKCIDDEISDSSDGGNKSNTKPTESHVCEMHRRMAVPLVIKRCSCNVTTRNKARFNSLLHKMKDSMREGGELRTIQIGMEMLSICDEDPKLHALVRNLGEKLFGTK